MWPEASGCEKFCELHFTPKAFEEGIYLNLIQIRPSSPFEVCQQDLPVLVPSRCSGLELGPCQVQTHQNYCGCQPCVGEKAPSQRSRPRNGSSQIHSQAPATQLRREKMKKRRGLRDQFDLGLCLYWLAPIAVGNPRSKLREKALEAPIHG